MLKRIDKIFVVFLVAIGLTSACSNEPMATPAPEGYVSTLAAQTLAAQDVSEVDPNDTGDPLQATIAPVTSAGSDLPAGAAQATLPRAATATLEPTWTPYEDPAIFEKEEVDFMPTVAPLLTDLPDVISSILGGGMVVETEPASSLDIAPAVGARAPDFSLVDARTGQTIQLRGLLGKPVLINFWATWCTYCEDEMPLIQKAYDKHQSEGLTVLAVDVEESKNKVVNFGDRLGLTFSLLLDSKGETAGDYLVVTFPTSYFVARDGVITAIAVGEMNKEQLDWFLTTILE